MRDRFRALYRDRLFRRRDAHGKPEGLARLYGGSIDASASRCYHHRAHANIGRGSGIAEWLVERLSEGAPALVGIDHGFSFPLRYFETHSLKPDWPTFLDDFQRHWPTDEEYLR